MLDLLRNGYDFDLRAAPDNPHLLGTLPAQPEPLGQTRFQSRIIRAQNWMGIQAKDFAFVQVAEFLTTLGIRALG